MRSSRRWSAAWPPPPDLLRQSPPHAQPRDVLLSGDTHSPTHTGFRYFHPPLTSCGGRLYSTTSRPGACFKPRVWYRLSVEGGGSLPSVLAQHGNRQLHAEAGRSLLAGGGPLQQQLALALVGAEVGGARAARGAPRRAGRGGGAGRRGRSAAGGSRRSAGSSASASTSSSAGLGAEGHRDRDGAVELDDRRAGERGEGVVEGDDPRPLGLLDAAAPARGRRRSRPAARRARGCRCSASARSSAASPRCTSSRSQRARSWSASSTGSPSGPTRARRREACSSISASSPCDLRLARHQRGEDPAQPQRVLAQRRAGSSSRRRSPRSPR